MPRPKEGVKVKTREKKNKLKRSDTPLQPPPSLLSNPYSNSSSETVACSNPFDDNSYLPRDCRSMPMPPQGGMPGPPPQGMPPQGMTSQPPTPMGVNQGPCLPPGQSPGPSPGPNPMNMGYQTGPNHGQMRIPLTVNQSPTHPNQIRYNNTGQPPMQHPGSGGPSPMQSQSPGGPGGYPNQPQPMPQNRPMLHMQGMMYPSDQPLIRNSQNQNAPPTYQCGGCHQEIAENDAALLCEAGCNYFYHQLCAGLTDLAFSLVKKDVFVEWACDACASTKNLPLYKYKP